MAGAGNPSSYLYTLTAVMSKELKELTREQVQKVGPESGHAGMMSLAHVPRSTIRRATWSERLY